MKQFNVTNFDNAGEYIVHMKGDNGNYDVSYDNGRIVFYNSEYSYTIPAGAGNSIRFQKPDRNTGKYEYIADSIRTLYRDTPTVHSAFDAIKDAETNTQYFTGDITVAGLSSPAPVIAPEGVKIYVNNTLTVSGSYVNNGDVVKFEVVSEKLGNKTKKVDLTVGNITHPFSVTTKQIPWEVLMHTTSKKINIGVGLAEFAWAGTSQFKTANLDNTGARNRLIFGDGHGVYNAFFTKKNITKIALVSGDGDLNNLTTNSNYLVYDLVESTGLESLYELILRLDIFNRANNPNWAANDEVYGIPKVQQFTAGTNGYSGLLAAAGGDWKTSGDAQTPDKFAIWGINRDADNDAQVLCAYSGNLGYGKGDNWRGSNPVQTLWSFWGNDWGINSQTQSIANSIQSSPGLADGATGTTSVYLVAF